MQDEERISDQIKMDWLDSGAGDFINKLEENLDQIDEVLK